MGKFIFRGKEHCYFCGWVSKTEFHFDFSPTVNEEFVDEEGDTYFIHCEYFEDEDFNGNEDVCQPFTFERWYEFETVNACSYFKDCLTNNECEHIKKIMYQLIGK